MTDSGLAHRLVLVAALAFAVFASSAAAAHPGHSHERKYAATIPAATHVPARSDAKFSEPAVRVQTTLEATAFDAGSANAPDSSACADRGCCGNSACHAGPSIVAPIVTVADPPSTGSTLRVRDGPALAALARDSLKRPPKSFA